MTCPPARVRGRSPRVRGSHQPVLWARSRRGSIPARAGEPMASTGSVRPLKVDPRACGGARSRSSNRPASRGRSPRVRGSLDRAHLRLGIEGSIPARAGEPSRAARRRTLTRVDPRACGGASRASWISIISTGRSPRVRGSLYDPATRESTTGSIPARAGEPPSARTAETMCRVDPRACGGANMPLRGRYLVRGRSPRVRGSRLDRWLEVIVLGSIPARAGEPWWT